MNSSNLPFQQPRAVRLHSHPSPPPLPTPTAPPPPSFACSETFQFVAAPFVAPTWVMRVLDPEAPEQRGAWRFSWQWLYAVLGFGLLINAINATNAFAALSSGPVGGVF